MDRAILPQPAQIKPLSAWVTAMSLTLWLSLCLGAMAFVIVLNVSDVEKQLTRYGDAYADHLNREMISSETILKGFSAWFGAVGHTDPARAARYVQQVVADNPQIFALEIVQSVMKDQLDRFVDGKRREGYPEFSVRTFSYEAQRAWQPPVDKPVYYPIVFMEPMPPGSEAVLGLDVDSVPFLKKAMQQSLKQRTPVASHPFRLVEGNLAYVVFFPIPPVFQPGMTSAGRGGQDELLVAMVIDADNLAHPARFPVSAGESATIHHSGYRHDDSQGQLMAMTGKRRSDVEERLFPEFVYKRSLATMGEPFVLTVRRQVGWSDLDLALLGMMGGLALLSSLILVAYLRASKHSRHLQIDNQNRLWLLANHDALTGLPNRMLLMDRMEQLIARAQRQHRRLAVMFLDLDEFKQVNDTYGHAVGDQLLRFVAERMRASVRQEDTVARMSGDEFVILIEGSEGMDMLDAVKQKIQDRLSEGFQIDGRLISVRSSTGHAIFPDDGDTPDDLIRQADLRMYADKQAHSSTH